MVKTKFKKAVSLVLAAVMSLTAFMGIGATTAFAAVGEKADVYLVDYPRSGDTNNNGEWGHGNLNYMNGWKGLSTKYTGLRAMGSYSGNIAYCIEPGTSQRTGDTLTEKDENFFNNISPNGTISGDDIRLLIGRILQYGYRGGISTSWKSQNESDANCIAHAYATQILIASFDDVLISGTTPYTIEEVDTAIRYVVPANQTAPINWKEVTTRNFTNILKKFSVTVTKSDREEGTPQGDATLAGAVYGIYKGETLVDKYVTDKNGQFTTKEYVCDNDWTIREITPSEGYLLDGTIHKVGAEPQLYTVEHNQTANDVTEQVMKGEYIAEFEFCCHLIYQLTTLQILFPPTCPPVGHKLNPCVLLAFSLLPNAFCRHKLFQREVSATFDSCSQPLKSWLRLGSGQRLHNGAYQTRQAHKLAFVCVLK